MVKKGVGMYRCLAIALSIAVFVSTGFGQAGNIIPRDSKIFIEPHEGFETFLIAAFENKKVPLTVVTDKGKADFVLVAVTERGEQPGWAQAIFLGKRKANEDASISITNITTSAAAWAYSVHKYNAKNGQQSTAESIAKHLKNKIESDEKNARKR